MVELEYNGERYMVDGWKWYRRLKGGEVIPHDAEYRDEDDALQWWEKTARAGKEVVSLGWKCAYRVPCTDPRPPFVVGQRVKVARKDDSCYYWTLDMDRVLGHDGMVVENHESPDDGCCLVSFGYNGFVFPPWCLDPVEPVHEDTLAELEMERIEREFPGYMDSLCGDESATRSVAPLDAEDELTPDEQRELSEVQQRLTRERLNQLVEISQSQFKTADTDTSDDPKPCMFCNRSLDCAADDWSTKQPHAGGEVQFIFAFGSTKFDLGMGNTVFSAYVCDECATGYVTRMRQETNITEPPAWIQRMDGCAPPENCEADPCGVMACNPEHLMPDNDPELDHILRKLKPHTHIAADVRRIKRECYQKLAALLPEEKR